MAAPISAGSGCPEGDPLAMILRDLSRLRDLVAGWSAPSDAAAGVGLPGASSLVCDRGHMAPQGFGPSVDPRLVTSYSPRVWWAPAEAGDSASSQLFNTRHADWACDLPGFALGLVIGRNSDTPGNRNGWKGITDNARRSIHRACAALEDQRARLAFWTVTLSPSQLDWIERYDSWPDFQSAIRHRLVRALRRRGLRPLVVGVVELHPERSAAECRPCPHIHVAFVGRAHRRARWALSTADLDLIICKALIAAQCFDLDVRAAGNVQPVRRSVGAYLSHYLKKSSSSSLVCLGPAYLCPRQWFFQSRPLLQLVRHLTVRLPLPFVAFLHERWSVISEQGWGEWQQVQIADPRAPAVFSILWDSVSAVVQALAWWQESQWQAEWDSNYRLLYERSHPGQHPQQHQHLRTASHVG